MKNNNHNINWIALCIISLCFFSACKSTQLGYHLDAELEKMIQTDKEFSNYSLENGLVKAFLLYADSNAVYLRDNSMPITGKNAITDYFGQFDDSSMELIWEPIYGDISKSYDLGYTYGVFTFKAGAEIQKGTYVSIWKKQTDGNWKWVLDSGNEGLE